VDKQTHRPPNPNGLDGSKGRPLQGRRGSGPSVSVGFTYSRSTVSKIRSGHHLMTCGFAACYAERLRLSATEGSPQPCSSRVEGNAFHAARTRRFRGQISRKGGAFSHSKGQSPIKNRARPLLWTKVTHAIPASREGGPSIGYRACLSAYGHPARCRGSVPLPPGVGKMPTPQRTGRPRYESSSSRYFVKLSTLWAKGGKR